VHDGRSCGIHIGSPEVTELYPVGLEVQVVVPTALFSIRSLIWEAIQLPEQERS
jgi:hypothetical protein